MGLSRIVLDGKLLVVFELVILWVCWCFCVTIIVSWNVRGLGRLEKRLAVRKMLRQHKADVLLLQETKISCDVENVIFDVWGARNCGWAWVPTERTSGGLISIWNEDKLQGIIAM